LMYLSEYDIPQAMELCDSFKEGPESYYCATGAYMEYVGKKDQADASIKSKYYPCQSNRYAGACFRYKSNRVAIRSYAAGKSLGDLINDCQVMQGASRLGCFHGLGNAHAVYIAKGLVPMSDVCGFGSDEDKYVCIEGAMERMAKYVPEIAKERCKVLSGWQYDLCEQALQNRMYNLEKPFELYLTD